MDNHKLIIEILDARPFHPYGHEASFKLGYLMEMLGNIANNHPDVAAELQDRLNSLKGKK